MDNHDNNRDAILKELEAGATITTMTVLRSLGTSELRTYIAQIRKHTPVNDRWVCKNNKRFKEYYIQNHA